MGYPIGLTEKLSGRTVSRNGPDDGEIWAARGSRRGKGSFRVIDTAGRTRRIVPGGYLAGKVLAGR